MDAEQFDVITRRLTNLRSRRTALAGGLGGALAVLTGTVLAGSDVEARRGGKKKKKKKKGKNKVEICHNGQTISVNSNAVDAHLDHGDTLGPCQTFCPPGRCNLQTGEVCCPPGSALSTDSCRPAGATCCGAGGFIEGIGASCCPNGSGSTSCPVGQVCCPSSAANACAPSIAAC